jgi:hypothetical protein
MRLSGSRPEASTCASSCADHGPLGGIRLHQRSEFVGVLDDAVLPVSGSLRGFPSGGAISDLRAQLWQRLLNELNGERIIVSRLGESLGALIKVIEHPRREAVRIIGSVRLGVTHRLIGLHPKVGELIRRPRGSVSDRFSVDVVRNLCDSVPDFSQRISDTNAGVIYRRPPHSRLRNRCRA